jgi:Protein of unknown function (DUF2514)
MMNPWVILGVVLAIGAASGAGYYQGNKAGRAHVQQLWDKEKAEQYAAYAAAQDQARQKEQVLQASADQLRQEKDREIRNLNARATALTNSLRDRPSRAATIAGPVPDTANAGCAPASCTGAGLSKEDGEFLAGEAARADQLRALLKQCYAQYETLRAP